MRSAFDRYIVVRITINKQRDGGFGAQQRFVHPVNGSVSFGPFLLFDSTKWNAKANELRGRDPHTLSLNEQLATIKADIKTIYSRQEKRHQTHNAPRPDVDSVKYEYLTGFLPLMDGDRYVYPESFVVRKSKQLRQSLTQPSSQAQASYELRPSASKYLAEYPLAQAVSVY